MLFRIDEIVDDMLRYFGEVLAVKASAEAAALANQSQNPLHQSQSNDYDSDNEYEEGVTAVPIINLRSNFSYLQGKVTSKKLLHVSC